MNTKNILVSVLVIVAAIILGMYLLNRPVQAPASPLDNAIGVNMGGQDSVYTFLCSDGKYITATFHIPEDVNVDIALSDGRTMSLPHALSADGARYANADESVVFWDKGTSAFIQEKGVTTYDNCLAGVVDDKLQ